jgi:hypothetical protein
MYILLSGVKHQRYEGCRRACGWRGLRGIGDRAIGGIVDRVIGGWGGGGGGGRREDGEGFVEWLEDNHSPTA